ncbi:MAG: hypothetical protein K6U00_03415 [Armatimonadetes bacterium]|nr:hypothetical protein [Armatimonadota bacterium]
MAIMHYPGNNFLQGRPVPGIRFSIAPAYIFHYVRYPVRVMGVNQTSFFDHLKEKDRINEVKRGRTAVGDAGGDTQVLFHGGNQGPLSGPGQVPGGERAGGAVSP